MPERFDFEELRRDMQQEEHYHGEIDRHLTQDDIRQLIAEKATQKDEQNTRGDAN
jgi:hypothetical protein